MENIDLFTDCNIDLDLCYACEVCNFMTNNTEHLEKHTTTMHHGMPPKFFTKIISESDDSSTMKRADLLSTLTYVDDTVGVNFPTRERDDNLRDSDSTLKLECSDDRTEVDSKDLKPIVKYVTNTLSKVKDAFSRFSSSCVKTEVEHDDKMFSDIKQNTIKQETLLPSLSNCDVKEEIIHCQYCQSCSYKNVDLSKLKSHKFAQHPTEAAVITNNYGEKILNIHDITFFCIKETCSFSTTLCNVYEQHLLQCCSRNQTLTRIETERLKSTIKYVLDFHNKLGLDTMSSFLDFVSSFNEIYTSNADQDKITDDIKYGSSSSILSVSKSALLSDDKYCLRSCNDEKRNSECLLSSVPDAVSSSVITQTTDLSHEVSQTETKHMAMQDKRNGQFIKTELYVTKFPSLNKSEFINNESSIDHLVSNNVELEIDIAGRPLYDDNMTSFSEEMRKGNIENGTNLGANCNRCGKIVAGESNDLMHTGTHDEEKGFKSDECTQSFGGDRIPFIHMRKSKEDGCFKCNDCGESLSKNSDLTVHMRMHTGEKPFECKECSHCFSVNNKLTSHMKIHTGKTLFKCRECGNCFQKKYLRRHMRVHSGEKPFKCNECGKSFSENGNLASHMKIVHRGEKPFKCHECGKGFSVKGRLTSHIRVHTGEKPFKCNDCGNSFCEKGNLTSHIRIVHMVEKLFKCHECGNCFQKKYLRRHMRVHSGEKPFKCNECGKSFSAKGNLASHMKIVHRGEKPFKCHECGKGFSVKGHLTSHIRVHTGEKPFKCNDCGNSFCAKAHLTSHIRIVHTVEKPFKCTECGEGFSVKAHCTKHMRVHTGEKPFKCTECGKGYRRRSSLTEHTRVHTGERPFK